jgi:hypothetical protein
MAKMRLNISIASLGRGHHIECKDLEELLEAEDTVRTACKNVTRFLEVAGTFNGSEVVIDYENGEERVHITQEAIPLVEYAPGASESSSSSAAPSFAPQREMGNDYKGISDFWRDRWLSFEQKVIDFGNSKGRTLTEQNVRALSVVAGIIFLVLLFQIF